MVRALILLAVAIVVALLPGSRLIRGAAVVFLVVAAGVVAYFAETEIVERERERAAKAVEEEARWIPPPPNAAVRIVNWTTTSPLRFSTYWTVDGTAGVQSLQSNEITGVEITATAYDCATADTVLAACELVGADSARGIFNPIAPNLVRQLRLRFRYETAPSPDGVLRIVPSVTAIRR